VTQVWTLRCSATDATHVDTKVQVQLSGAALENLPRARRARATSTPEPAAERPAAVPSPPASANEGIYIVPSALSFPSTRVGRTRSRVAKVCGGGGGLRAFCITTKPHLIVCFTVRFATRPTPASPSVFQSLARRLSCGMSMSRWSPMPLCR
jgi:hypothetical protein